MHNTSNPYKITCQIEGQTIILFTELEKGLTCRIAPEVTGYWYFFFLGVPQRRVLFPEDTYTDFFECVKAAERAFHKLIEEL